MAQGKGTAHHKLKGRTGLVMIITLLPAIIFFLGGGVNGLTGLLGWLDGPIGAIVLLIFFTSGLWYCKLEFDEVVLDYADSGMRSFGLLANKIIAFIAWAAAVAAILKVWLGA